MTKKNDASQHALDCWALRIRILTYLSPARQDPNSECRNPLEELGELYVTMGNLLRAITPLIEPADAPPPTGRKDTLRELWPWYRERGLAVYDQSHTTRPLEDPAYLMLQQLSAICAKLETNKTPQP